MPAHILVAGGGIGGLATALALSRHRHRADVFEQAAVFGEIGAGVQLGPNATRRLQQLDLGQGLAAIAARPDALVVHSADSGSELARMPLGDTMQQRYGAPYFCVHRADLHGLLLEAVRARGTGALVTAARIAQVETSDDLVCMSSNDARAWEGEAIVGADGLWSLVRRQLDTPSAAQSPRVTGHTAWRSLIEQAKLPAAMRRRQVDVWLGPRLHAVAYPVRGGDWLNVVVIAESAPAGDARDWDQASSIAALRQAMGRSCAGLQSLLDAMPGWRAWSLGDRAPMTGAAEMAHERVALVGDAAHPMVPYLAQGAGMAIEDALALADALGEGSAAEVPAAFARYAEARWARNAQVQARARRNGEIFHATGPVRLGRDIAMRLLGAKLLDQPWLYGG
ncbi:MULTISPECIES: FAD-dependent monooxygenase [Variovorax]|jgi:salicylate hydroxylase|uniref:FAD-dependent monooxygenase n=1 Tax=Variovorax TaxID=34072 RepID=UPI00086AE0D5|nr:MULTISPECIES: FAD-dependent monooxygenase [Variovorax]MBN8756413.1 FAD-dependent monooxygenase [Variovorax sp.]ODU14435.1 MAG: FAD-dependent oxidoreductase [Variovorax sp. SCN 67-85]ODV18800.1 MAG: FAD-dependent oxidoreductase [Variovorax sp. SCN 67-20]OJZ02320.1 MAG: FAD-dependent oxidoreductase [Variovorax sp. 67-131]UKI10278.1 FAD-dependent monooxygenase [Variovorax paradoxus]